MQTELIHGQKITIHRYNTVVVGAGAAGMNCAKRLYEFMARKGVENPQHRIVVVTKGLALGTSRMSGSDKQTYYKLGTSPDVPDSAEEFAQSLTAWGCCHGDLAIAEAVGSLRAFYNLIEAGVPFPHDQIGAYFGYKTDNDPYERATSAGPRTSKFMSECLQRQVAHYGIQIHDCQEIAELLTVGHGSAMRIVGVLTIDRKKLADDDHAINVYVCRNLVLAAGGPGELYETTVYPKGQTGIHGIAFKAGLAAENLTESQFGLASIKFRWNVSGTYMQAIPRIFSTDSDGSNSRDFLADFFPTVSKMATNIFLKGYQWPFDSQKIQNHQSSLIDLAVLNETQKGRRVFMDFLNNPIGSDKMKPFRLEDLERQALDYLARAAALQQSPIERLEHMNPLAVKIFKEHNIDLRSQPLEIAVCAQHNNGGFAVDKWWQSNIPHTFVIGEMAGTHGVKRPGGAALNAGQVGALRAAEYIVNAHGLDVPKTSEYTDELELQIAGFITKLQKLKQSKATLEPAQAIKQIQHRMTMHGGHIRRLTDAENALSKAVELYKSIHKNGLKLNTHKNILPAIEAENLALTSVAYLKAIVELSKAGNGSRGSYLVLDDDGIEPHPGIVDITTGNALKFKPENKKLRNSILRIQLDEGSNDLFTSETIPVRPVPTDKKAFELAWRHYIEGMIYK